MAKSKEQFLRFRIIDSELRRKDWVKTSEIKEKIEDFLGETVEIRTIQKDIESLKNDSRLGFDAPIEYDNRKKAYKYTDKNFSILNFNLKDAELNALTFYASSINLYRDYGIFKDFSSAIQKVVDAVSLGSKLKDNTDSSLIIQTDNSRDVKGSNFLTSIVQSIIGCLLIKFDYRKFNDKAVKQWNFRPHLLKEYRNRWYIIGYDLDNKVRTFALDRIDNLVLTDESFTKSADFDHNLYFKHSFGINRADGKKVIRIILKYTTQQASYIESLSIHPTQRIIKKSKSGSLTISIDVVPSYELYEYLLGQGESVKIISPKSLATEIKDRLKRASQQYK
ncbi:MAG TPA: WYL domain-containing protein [Bacteroidia bacterium]|nr:WYL domain-containing protein [Bacteroidia bacterium]HRH08160.1 WYL domain-containing protein [Bacteroidia bacterium]